MHDKKLQIAIGVPIIYTEAYCKTCNNINFIYTKILENAHHMVNK